MISMAFLFVCLVFCFGWLGGCFALFLETSLCLALAVLLSAELKACGITPGFSIWHFYLNSLSVLYSLVFAVG